MYEDPTRHTERLRQMIEEVIMQARDDAKRVSEPQAQALFEMSAEILLGLNKALIDYERKQEPAFLGPPD